MIVTYIISASFLNGFQPLPGRLYRSKGVLVASGRTGILFLFRGGAVSAPKFG